MLISSSRSVLRLLKRHRVPEIILGSSLPFSVNCQNNELMITVAVRLITHSYRGSGAVLYLLYSSVFTPAAKLFHERINFFFLLKLKKRTLLIFLAPCRDTGCKWLYSYSEVESLIKWKRNLVHQHCSHTHPRRPPRAPQVRTVNKSSSSFFTHSLTLGSFADSNRSENLGLALMSS